MAFLVAIGLVSGEWDVVVMDRLTIGTKMPDFDVLGRVLPAWRRIEAHEGIPKGEAVRLAQMLKGMTREDRYRLFRERAPDLKLRLSQNPDAAAFNGLKKKEGHEHRLS